jgi:hypothetical protein
VLSSGNKITVYKITGNKNTAYKKFFESSITVCAYEFENTRTVSL